MVNKNVNNLDIYFVYKDNEDPESSSDTMQIAFRACCDQFTNNKSIKWIPEKECLKFTKENTSNKTVFVFPEFIGASFAYLQNSTKAVILGPRCIICCINENVEIPVSNSPIFTLPMRKIVMSASCISVGEKEAIRQKVSYMGGLYLNDLNVICTHLVTKSVCSKKYEIAASRNMCIMHPDWVTEVWQQSQEKYMHATDEEFDKFKLPCFYSLNITSTGLSGTTLNSIKTLVVKNGGHYNGVFQSEIVDILLLEQRSTESQKFKAAVRFKKLCLSPHWVFDSIDKGYALPFEKYKISGIKISTPTKSDGRNILTADFNPDCTNISEISYLAPDKPLAINETLGNITRLSVNIEQATDISEDRYKKLLDGIDLRSTTKHGYFLDGCNIYLSGFINEEKDKLNKILSIGGATRFEELNDKVTHVLTGKSVSADLKYLEDHKLLPYILKFDWLIESMKLKQPAKEDDYIVNDVANDQTAKIASLSHPSPITKKSIKFMNNSFKRPNIPKFRLDEKLDAMDKSKSTLMHLEPKTNADFDLVQQYCNATNVNSNKATVSVNESAATDTCGEYSEDYTIKSFLEGTHCYIYGFSDVYCEQMMQDCDKAGAVVVGDSYKDVVDFLITPSEALQSIDAPVRAKTIVNDLWLDESIRLNERANTEHYYFRPIIYDCSKYPLANETVVVSIYSGVERSYLVKVAQTLGADVNNTYVKSAKPILICPKPEGPKYTGAVKWGNVVLTADWLCRCLEERKRINEVPYLVGEAVASSNNKEDDSATNDKENISNVCVEVPLAEPQLEDKVEPNLANDEENFLCRQKKLVKVSSISSPSTPGSSLNISDLVKVVPTPQRPFLYQTLKSTEETPNTKKFKKLIATPGGKAAEQSPATPVLPDCLRTEVTPYGFRPDASPRNHEMHKRKIQALEMYYRPISDSKRRKSTTPISELKRRFWKSALGDDYDQGTSKEVVETNTTPKSTSVCSITTEMSPNDETNAKNSTADFESPGFSDNVKRLSDLIQKSREASAKKLLEKAQIDDDEIEEKLNLKRIDTQLLDIDSEPLDKLDDIGWRDPDDFFQSQRFIKNQEPKKAYVCSLSNIESDSRKEDMMAKIIQLGGELTDQQVFDSNTTHFFCDKPNRGEKILSSIASGRWVLNSKYILDSAKENQFLKEELYQWGNPNAKSLPQLSSSEQSIAKAAYNWRHRILYDESKNKGAFTGFRVILRVYNKDAFDRLLKAGGGHVIDAHEPFKKSDIAKTATHCLVDIKKFPLTSEDHRTLNQAGVLVLNNVFLNAYLTQEHLPDPNDYLLQLPK